MRALWSSFGLDCTGELADRATCALARGKTPVRTGVEWRMRGTHHQGEATRLGHQPCASRRDHVAPEAAAVVPAHAPDRARKKCNPLRTNNLRSTNYPNPRKKRNPYPTTTYAQSTPAATPSFPTNPTPAQKRNPLPSNTLRPQFRFFVRPKHTRNKSPRPSASGPKCDHTISANTLPSTGPGESPAATASPARWRK